MSDVSGRHHEDDVFSDVGGVVADSCLLYTSDAADERSSVDLGGRRIIKKKNNEESVLYNSYKETPHT